MTDYTDAKDDLYCLINELSNSSRILTVAEVAY